MSTGYTQILKYFRRLPVGDLRLRRRPWFLVGFVALGLAILPVQGQKTSSNEPTVVQPGAPGKPTRVLPPTTRAKLPPTSPSDIEFMKGMIMHHAQAVEMTDLIESRTENKNIRLLGGRISHSQIDEMRFMKRWLELRGESTEMKRTGVHGHNASPDDSPMLMPGMLTAEEMKRLREAKGAEFDTLFLKGMIQHHNGALIMVKQLFDSPGSGQDAELFNFATDVDSGQRAEINTMRTLLGEIS